MSQRIAFVAVLISLAPPLAAQDVRNPPPVMPPIETKAPPPKLDRETLSRGHRMLHDVWETLKQNYYDPKFRGIDTAAALRVADSTLEAAPNQAFMVAAVEQFLDNLKDSHTWLIPPGLAQSVDYGWSWQMIGERCYVIGVKKGSDAETQGLRLGDLVLSIDRVQPTRANIQMIGLAYFALRPRPGMHVSVLHPGDSTASGVTLKSTMTRVAELDLTDNSSIHRYINEQEANAKAIHRWVTVSDSVLIWQLRSFVYQDEEIDHLMDRARRHKVLILDLRGDGGGSVETFTRLLGHFFADRFVAARIQQRTGVDSVVVRPQGRQPFAGQVMVLIDSRSASASEVVSRTLQLRRNAMVIGDRSAGAVMAAIHVPLSLMINGERSIDYGMSVTVSDPVMLDGARLEVTGVIPNVAAVPTALDIANHRDPALSFALEMAGVKMDPLAAGRIFSEH